MTSLENIEPNNTTKEHSSSPPKKSKFELRITDDKTTQDQLAEMIAALEVKKKKIYYRKLTPDARTPTYGSDWAAGADLCSAYDIVVPAKSKAMVGTGLQVEIPRGYYGRVAPRSGLAAKKFIDVGAGVVDSDYRGHLNVLLFNFSDEDFEIKKGDRIAQLICEQIRHCEFEEVEVLGKTKRNEGGFGSTGV